MKVLGITLARGGSKRVSGKNARLLGGRPLISYTIEQALKSRMLTDYVVSTDTEAIQAIARDSGAKAPFLRPPHLASDEASSADALVHAVEWMEGRGKGPYDFIVELMATNPFKSSEDIDACVRLLVDTGADSVIAVAEVGDAHPARIKKIEDGRLVDFCCPEPRESRRQDLLPRAFLRAGAIYALRREEIMVWRRRHGSAFSVPYVLPHEKSLNIDSELDFALAEVLIQRHLWSEEG